MGDAQEDKLVDGKVGTPPANDGGGNEPEENYSPPRAVGVEDPPGDL